MVRFGEEQEEFKLLTLEFMSEESDPDDTGTMAVHQLLWCSKSNSQCGCLCMFLYTLCSFVFTELTNFLQHLDGRTNAAIKESKNYAANGKVRVIGNALESLPPAGAPSWKINRDWTKGIILFLIFALSYSNIFFAKFYRSFLHSWMRTNCWTELEQW